MKKILVLTLSFILLLSLIGCGKTIKTEDGSISLKNGKIEISNEEGSTTIGEEGITFQGEDEEGESSLSFNEEGTSLPEGYPKDLVPVIKGGKVVMSGKDASDDITSYWLSILVEKEFKDVADYYKKIMKDAEDKQEINTENMYVVEGTIDEHFINVSCTKDSSSDGDVTMVSIVVDVEN